MTMRITFELTDRDLRFFRKALKQSREAVRDAEESDIVEAISDVLEEIRQSDPLPDFVGKRIPELESLIRMLADSEWQLPESDRERLLATFCYFADPEDILPDDIPVIGYLDDVIMIELVARELQHVREAYDDFCSFRDEFERSQGEGVDPVPVMDPEALTDHAAGRDPHPVHALELEGVHHRHRVGHELVQPVGAGRRVGVAVAAPVVAQQAKMSQPVAIRQFHIKRPVFRRRIRIRSIDEFREIRGNQIV